MSNPTAKGRKAKRQAPRSAAPPETAAAKPPAPRKSIPLRRVIGENADQDGARVAAQLMAPEFAAWRVIAAAEKTSGVGAWMDTPGMLAALRAQGAALSAGELGRAEAMLMNQATALQTLFGRLIELGFAQDRIELYELQMRLGLKAQAQARATLEALANLRMAPVIYARQANVAAGGPLQVNNGHAAPARDHKIPPNQLLEPSPDDGMDAGTQSRPVTSDPPLEAVAAQHRAKNGGG